MVTQKKFSLYDINTNYDARTHSSVTKIFFATLTIIANFFIACSPSTKEKGEPPTKQWHLSTIAGSTKGYKDGIGSAVQFRNPFGIAIAPDGMLYIADGGNNRIRKLEYK